MHHFKLTEDTYCIEYFHAKAGCREKMIAALLKLVPCTKAETGCLQYDLIQDSKNPDLIILIVKFANRDQMKLHENQQYIRDFAEGEMQQYCEQFSWNEGKGIE